ncbi:MAG: hypothetical protein UIB61_04110 [Treponema sp.]|nr:hypothetical protein [Treponema sp.]
MKTAAFNSIVAQVDTFSYDQCLALLGKITQSLKKLSPEAGRKNISPIEQFAGLVNDADSKLMMDAVQECRKVDWN